MNFKLAASISLSFYLQNNSWATWVQVFYEEFRYYRTFIRLQPTISPRSFINYKVPYSIPVGILKTSISSFHIGGISVWSSRKLVCKIYSPIVSLTAKFWPGFLLIVALMNLNDASMGVISSKTAWRVICPNFLCLSEAKMILNGSVCYFLALIKGLASIAPQAIKSSLSNIAIQMVLPQPLNKLLMKKVKCSLTCCRLATQGILLV